MLDIKKLDESLKLKSLGRFFDTKHPLMSQIREKLHLNDFFFPTLTFNCDNFTRFALDLLKADRHQAIKDDRFDRNRTFKAFLKNIKIKNLVNGTGKISIAYFRLRNNGKTVFGDLSKLELTQLERFIMNKELLSKIKEARSCPDRLRPTNEEILSYPYRGKLVKLTKLTSKEIRTSRDPLDPICIYKCGLILTPNETLNYMNKLRKLTSVAHRNTVLRALHGDVFTNDRLFRRNLRQDPLCPRCEEVDTLEHRFERCEQVIALVAKLKLRTNRLGDMASRDSEDILRSLMAAYTDTDVVTLTIHAEIIKIVCSQSELANPNQIINQVLNRLFIRESSTEVKNMIAGLLQD